MGVLNITPDSFSDGGYFFDPRQAVDHALKLLDQGADLLDIGGESTRPSASPLPPADEQGRILPVLSAILIARPNAILSVDTYHASTAQRAIEVGAEIVNDVSGHLWDEAMSSTCARLGCGNILMHTHNRPAEWAYQAPLDDAEILPLVEQGLRRCAEVALAAGIARETIVLDPGFGFGKLGDSNYALLARFDGLQGLGYPLLAGISRKRFLAHTIAPLYQGQLPAPGQRTHATTAANVAAVLAGAHILRVHDVPQAMEAGAVADAILRAGQGRD
jgi:dihydropteroate synthase